MLEISTSMIIASSLIYPFSARLSSLRGITFDNNHCESEINNEKFSAAEKNKQLKKTSINN